MRHVLARALLMVLLVAISAPAALAAVEKTLPDGRHVVGIMVPDMECAMCIRAVQGELRHVEGVSEVKVDDVNRTVTVKFDPALTDVKRLQTAIRKAGFTSQPVEPTNH